MKTGLKKRLFKKILVPVVHGCESSSAINAGHAIAGADNVLLVGFVYVPEGESLSSAAMPAQEVRQRLRDRKSTRLNSSHSSISYAVFCLKKKKKRTRPARARA